MEEYIEILKIFKDKEKEKLAMQPRVISIHRRKLLIALKELPDEPINDDDNQFTLEYSRKNRINFTFLSLKPQSRPWADDTVARDIVDGLLKKHATFHLSKYLDSAKSIFLAYSCVGCSLHEKECMEYILTHARQFGQPAERIFTIDNSRDTGTDKTLSDPENYISKPSDLSQLPDSKVFNKIRQLIRDLQTAYDEDTFQILNANATYFTLLMLRRLVKNRAQFLNAFKKIDTHDSYVRLCPFPLDNQLPACGLDPLSESSLASSACLAIAAHLATGDARTRRVLRTACIPHLEWYGLQLPHLFFKVTDLYNITAGLLFDSLLSVDTFHDNILQALIHFSNCYYAMHESSKSGATHKWFPFCRLLDNTCEKNLSAKAYSQICMVLGYLVDLKLGFDKSTIRNAHWMDKFYQAACISIAKILQNKFNSNV